MKTGDRVKLIGIPSGVKNDAELQTLALFEKCLGKTFLVADIEIVPGLSQPLAKLDVGQVVEEPTYMHTIWVEEEYLEVESAN